MKRLSWLTVLVTTVLVVGVVTPAQAIVSFVGTFTLPADGTIVSVALAPGAYDLGVSGTYDYDTTRPGDQFADAECSTDTPLWRDPVDQVEAIVPPAPLSPWHRQRFIVGALVPPGFGVLPFPFLGLPIFTPSSNVDALDVAIGATGSSGSIPPLAILEWEPVPATPVNSSSEVDAGCNEATHHYEAQILVPPGVTTVDFQIYDPFYPDNVGSLTLDIFRIG